MTTRTIEQSAENAALAGNNSFSLISHEKLLELYASMVKCRMIAARARTLFQQTGIEAAVGQEAAVVGAAIDLRPEDTIAAVHCDPIIRFMQGAPLGELFRDLSARAASLDSSAQLDIATGVALANKTKKNGRVVVVFLSDGTASSGSEPGRGPNSWQDALHIADVHQLPILFVSLNNVGNDDSQTVLPQSKTKKTAMKAQNLGLPRIPVDGNDVVAVYRVATESIAHARRGNGPTLIECVSYRLRIDPGADHDSEEAWHCSQADDPILNMEEYITRKGLFSADLKHKIAAVFTKELDFATKAAGH